METHNSILQNLTNQHLNVHHQFSSPYHFRKKDPQNPQELTIITMAFRDHLGPHILQTYDRIDKLGPPFLIPRRMLSRTNGLNHISNNPNLHIVGISTPLGDMNEISSSTQTIDKPRTLKWTNNPKPAQA